MSFDSPASVTQLATSAPMDVRVSSCPAGDVAMARYAVGDDDAFSDLYDNVAPRLLAFLLRRTSDRPLAEDVLQQTFLQLHRARGTFAPGAPVLPWAVAIARRVLIDELRRAVRRPATASAAAPDAADPLAQCGYQRVHLAEVSERLESELARLPPSQREAFELVRLDGLTLSEAAGACGTSVGALKSRSHRAYETLRVALGALLGA